MKVWYKIVWLVLCMCMMLSSCDKKEPKTCRTDASYEGHGENIPFEGFRAYSHIEGSILYDPLTMKLQVPGAVDYTSVPLYVYRAKIEKITKVLENEKVEETNAVPTYLTYFQLHITYNYTVDEEMDEHVVAYYRGTATHVLYGDVLPKVGEEFILAENNVEIMDTFGMHMVYRILKFDDEEYALPYYILTENILEHGIEPPEAYKTVYTAEHDKAIVEYLQNNGIVNPAVNQIFKLDDLIPQLIEIQSARNAKILAGTFVYDPDRVSDKTKYTSIIPYDYTGGINP